LDFVLRRRMYVKGRPGFNCLFISTEKRFYFQKGVKFNRNRAPVIHYETVKLTGLKQHTT